jgi:Tfp pilus assembly protein PilN
MPLFWMGAILVVVLACLAASAVLLLLWRRSSIRKMEAALLQLQNELTRINSLLEEARSTIVRAATEGESHPAPKLEPQATDSDVEG